MKHPLINRTSPKGPGQPFVGTCASCGKPNALLTDDDCTDLRRMTQQDALLEAIEGDAGKPGWPDPTPEMLATPEFEAVWRAIKSWDIGTPHYNGYCGATGNHVRAILDALAAGMKVIANG